MTSLSRSNRHADEPDVPGTVSVDDIRPSKTRRKREMSALQQLGERLVGLPAARLAQLPLSERMHDAILEAGRITSREARRRQLQYIGRLMRDADAEAISSQLSEWDRGTAKSTARFHAVERWRTRLLDQDDALTQFLREFPTANIQHMRSLIRAARKEAAQNASLSPGREPQRRHYRALFQEIRQVIEADLPANSSNMDTSDVADTD